MTLEPILAIGAGLVGLCVGSFSATAAIRAARSEPYLVGRSHCDDCGVSLTFATTVPLASYLAVRGTCHSCGARIDPIHPVAELLGAGIAVTAICAAPWPRSGLLATLGLLLLATALIDFKTRRLPDPLTIAIAIVAGVLSATAGLGPLTIGLVAAVISFVLLEGVRRLFRDVLHRPALGLGDVKLFAALALWLGIFTPWAMVAGSAFGLAVVAITRPKDRKIAFGPPLAAGAFGVGLLGEALQWPRF